MSDIPENLPDEALAAVDRKPGAPEHEERTPAPHSGVVRLGPTPLYLPWLLFINPLTWLGIALMVFAWSAEFRAWAYHLCDGLSMLQRGMISYFVWNKSLMIPFWFWPLFASTFYATIRALTTHYVLSDDGILTIKHGLLTIRSPGGPFQQYLDTIPLGLVRDADLRRGLPEMIMGTGTISIRSRESADGSGWSHLYHVPHAERARAQILDHSPVRDTKVIVSA